MIALLATLAGMAAAWAIWHELEQRVPLLRERRIQLAEDAVAVRLRDLGLDPVTLDELPTRSSQDPLYNVFSNEPGATITIERQGSVEYLRVNQAGAFGILLEERAMDAQMQRWNNELAQLSMQQGGPSREFMGLLAQDDPSAYGNAARGQLARLLEQRHDWQNQLRAQRLGMFGQNRSSTPH
ncbi:MAG TPA: hypothetical protein VFX29_00855 [Longimicrobiaceae bacterium]|nr:hypothetical protein [Longimicrobiaceae bacterium]